jgi:DNA-damage-inducible protein J
MTKSLGMYIRIEPQLKKDVEAIYSQYGISLTEAINIFLYQSRKVGGLPFDLRPLQQNIEVMVPLNDDDQTISREILQKHGTQPSENKATSLSENGIAWMKFLEALEKIEPLPDDVGEPERADFNRDVDLS